MNRWIGTGVLAVASCAQLSVCYVWSGEKQSPPRAFSSSATSCHTDEILSNVAITTQDSPDREMKGNILRLVTLHPMLDDEEIGDELGVVPVEASRLLREMEAEGLLRRA